jgi:two-component system, chemotaxis family, sensor kinase CheA
MSRDPYKYFRVEARELLDNLSRGVLELEKGAPSADLVARLLRFAHTLKGAARVVKQPEIAELAHAIEDALEPLRGGSAVASRETVDTILVRLDAIGTRLTALAPPPDETPAVETPPEEPLRAVRIDVADMDALLEGLAVAGTEFGAMRDSIGAVERARNLGDLLVGQLSTRRPWAAGLPSDGQTLARASSLAEELRSIVHDLERTLATSLDRLEREVRQVSEATERLRLVEVNAVFASLERVARDSARAVGRSVEFEARGGDVRLDAHVLGVVQRALVQLVRNAVAHGIEPESERVRDGKARAGRVVLHVARRGNRVVFTCEDDGRGLDLDALRRQAEARGLLSDDARQYGADELVRLLLQGGLTTSDAVTELSGRGVGMDVVREAASKLGGSVSVRTEARRGSAVEIVVPATIASLTTLRVKASSVTAAIPLDSVRRTMRVPPSDIVRTATGESIVFEEATVPFVPLGQLLASRSHPRDPDRAWSAVVIAAGEERAAVGVDALLGTANVVVRPLPALAPADAIVLGASLDAAGNPQVVLDPAGLVAAAQRGGTTDAATTTHFAPILVIDDSLTTRMLEQSILESAGYLVDLATSAEEALTMARRRSYGLFLVDVEMPGMDGFEFVERTRADATMRDVPAILVTSRAAREDRERGTEVGAVAYVVKSDFDQSKLLEIIRRHVRHA